MDQRFSTHLKLLILGLTIFAMAQQNQTKCVKEDEILKDEKPCPNNWICPSNVTCDSHNLCRCRNGYYQCRKKGLRYCRDANECLANHGCGMGSNCTNTDGSFYCECDKDLQPNTIQFCPSQTTEDYLYCDNKKVKDRCEFSRSELERKEKCDKMDPPDTDCSLLQTAFALKNSSCQPKYNITTEKAKEQLKQDTKQLSDKLNLINNDASNVTSTKVGQTATLILNFVETIILKSFIDAPRNQSITTAELNVSMKVSRDICTPGVEMFSLRLNDNIMEVPCTKRETDGGVFIVYKDLDSSLNGNDLFPSKASEDEEAIINSRVVTGAITNSLTSNVIFTLVHIQDLTSSHFPICVFWDPKNNGWSKEGCTTEHTNDTHTICSCNHLSSFAVLMAPFGHEDNHGLKIVSNIGLSLSVLCLVLCLLTFILCRALKSAHTSVLIALCSCLLLAHILFLVGIHQTCCKVLCSIIAGCLQFFFLCAFCWMSVESILLFLTVRNLRAVNYMTSRRSNFPVMCLLGFGVPAVIVGISAAIQSHDYGTEKYCWLRPQSGALWSFLGPVAVLIITNTTLLVCTVVLLRIRLATLNTNVSTLKNNRILTFKAMAQLFILGCTWGIGYFQFDSSSLVIAYLFTICNSLQGVYIFLVHCGLNNQVRHEYRKLFYSTQKRSKESTEDSTPHSGTKSLNLSEITKPVVSEESSEPERKVNWKIEPM